MHRIVLTFLIYVFSCGFANAQIVHFCYSTNYWRTGFSSRDYTYDTEYLPSGTEFIDSIAYIRIGRFLCREDTLSHKVFVRRSGVDTVESLLYDFSLNVGDTLTTQYARHYVDSVSTILVGGISHKIWSFIGFWHDSSVAVGFLGLRDYWVIEGIGSTKGPFFPFFPSEFEGSTDLYCFRLSGVAPALSLKVQYYDNTTCGLFLDVESTSYNSNNVSILPNPIEKNSVLTFPNELTSATLIVVNSIGAVICKETIFGTNSYPIGEAVKSSGVYFYTLINNESGAIYKGTFVKE